MVLPKQFDNITSRLIGDLKARLRPLAITMFELSIAIAPTFRSTYETLRDYLLPLLMNGQVKIQ